MLTLPEARALCLFLSVRVPMAPQMIQGFQKPFQSEYNLRRQLAEPES